MIFMKDLAELADKSVLKDIYCGVYVMQNSTNPKLFLTGALGQDDNNISALVRLKQNSGWRYVFFAHVEHNDKMYAAEAILFGRLCEAFKFIKQSHFEVAAEYTLEEVVEKAVRTIASFCLMYQYPLWRVA